MWSPRKILWAFWTVNFLFALIFTLTSIFNGKNIDDLYAKIAEDDLTTNHLLGGLIGTTTWGVVLVALFSVFSLIVLLRKETIALTGAGFSYGVIVGSAFHMFFALIEVSVSLNAHDEWLKSLPNNLWDNEKQNLFMAVYYLGFISAAFFLILAIVMIVFMKAVIPDEVAGTSQSEPTDSFGRPLSMFRDRYGVSSPSSSSGV